MHTMIIILKNVSVQKDLLQAHYTKHYHFCEST